MYPQPTRYPHIVRVEGVCGGEPIVEGTRVAVRVIAGYYDLGMSADDIASALPSLAPAQAHSALEYYRDNREEIERYRLEHHAAAEEYAASLQTQSLDATV